jgi:hypothetical protein
MANERLMLSILSGQVLSPQKLLLYNQESGRKKREVYARFSKMLR